LRGTPEHIPTQPMAEYYTQRAGAGLIISEGIPVVPQGVGYANVPGIWSPDQIEAWKLVTNAVHQARGRFLHNSGMWGASRTHAFWKVNFRLLQCDPACRHVSLVRPVTEYVTPRALETSEIPGIVKPSAKEPRTRNRLVLTASKSMGPMVTSSISSCRTDPIIVPTHMADRLKTAPGSCLKWPIR